MTSVVDGRPAEGGDVGLALAARMGHFTALQVRGGRAKGLDLHLARLERATTELYGTRLDTRLVLDSLRLAVTGEDASVRVHVVDDHVIVTTGAPVDADKSPKALKSVNFQRFLPDVKHGGGFPQAHLARQARLDGFDEVLLTTPDGHVIEGAVTNLGCFDGERLVWPDAPMLEGITMRLLNRKTPHVRRALKPRDLRHFPEVFVCNSWGVSPVGRVDDLPMPSRAGEAMRLYDEVPWEEIP
ncbi:aminotransferase class IV [Nonomuraea sp. NPDC050663]|uniref:aminotransferase class IV n=1 Tax=Nonomuraea sp. NPDC050663 TaxID=3364370 RepID=UPI0037B4B436